MGRIVLNLEGMDRQLEVFDEKGRLLGQYIPQDLYLRLLYDWAKQQFADETDRNEARAEMKSLGGLTTEQAISHINQIARGAKGKP